MKQIATTDATQGRTLNGIMRRLLPILIGLGVVVVLAIGLSQAGGGEAPPAERFDLAQAREQLAGAPGPLAGLHEQSGSLLDGGRDAFAARLAALKGRPVVVNKWASWCGPCRAEFHVFQRLSARLGKEVAFLGLNSGDNRDDAADFLREYPVPFPSYVDPSEKIARSAGAPANYPITVFYDRDGRRAFVHQGQYRTEADLAADIERYAR